MAFFKTSETKDGQLGFGNTSFMTFKEPFGPVVCQVLLSRVFSQGSSQVLPVGWAFFLWLSEVSTLKGILDSPIQALVVSCSRLRFSTDHACLNGVCSWGDDHSGHP